MVGDVGCGFSMGFMTRCQVYFRDSVAYARMCI
jgi:hypothetical protein